MPGVLPAIGAAAPATFLVVSAVAMDDFWVQAGANARDETTVFPEKFFEAGGATVFLVFAGVPWPCALDPGL